MEIIREILSVVIFLIGFLIGFSIKRKGEEGNKEYTIGIKNPIEKIQEIKEEKKSKKNRTEIETYLQNIENYPNEQINFKE